MAGLFPKKVVKKIPKLYEDKSRVKELLEKADKDALKELEYEVVIDKTIEELRKFLSGSKEKEIKKLLKGILDVDTNKEVIKYFRKLRTPLRKTGYILDKNIRLNDGVLKTIGELNRLIKSYTGRKRRSYIFKTFESICKNRYQERESLKIFLWNIKESVNAMLRIIEEGLKSVEKFDYETVLRDLESEKGRLYAIVKNELAVYGIESGLFKDAVGLEKLESYLQIYSRDKSSLGRGTKSAKRKYYLLRARKIILISAAAYQLAVPVSLSLFSSWSFPPGSNANMHPEIQQKMQHEIVYFKNEAGFTLVGWFFDNPSTDKTIVMCHGTNMNKSYFMKMVQIFNKEYDVFIFDFAGFGETKYKTFHSLSYRETGDLYSALEYLSKRGIEDVVLYGYSMGGVVCINVAANPPPNIRVNALITHAAFYSLDQLTTDAARGLFFLPPMDWVSKRIMESAGGYKMKDIQPGEQMKNVECPVLVIGGSKDFLVKPENAEYLFNNAPKGKREIYLHGGDHWRYSDEEVGSRSMNFLQKYF